MSNITVLMQNALVSCETTCNAIAKLAAGIYSNQNTWLSIYGNRYYYEGFGRKDWNTQQGIISEKLTRIKQLLASLDQPIKRIRTELEHKKLPLTKLNSLVKYKQEKETICSCLLGDLTEILATTSSCLHDDPSNFKVGTKLNKEYKSLTKALSEECKTKIDSWFHQVSSISGLGYTVSRLLSVIELQIKTQVEVPTVNMNASFAEQIQEYKTTQEQKIAITPSEKWVTDQYAVFKNVTKDSLPNSDPNELLICEIPIILVKSYIHKSCLSLLEYIGYRTTRLLGTYIIVENALLFRMSTKLFGKEDSVTKFHSLWQQYLETNTNKKFIANGLNENHLVPTGPLVRKGSYFYAWLIPQSLINDLHNGGFSLREWDLKLI